jgi:prepilin-type N-terminal cleavage/methylation domain-containing protein
MTGAATTLRSRRAFTLIELIVTISIVVLLVAITVSAMVALGRKSEVTRTESTLQLLDLALSEWEAMAGRKTRWGVDDTPFGAVYEMNAFTPHVFTMTELLTVLGRNTQTREIIARIEPSLVFKIDSEAPRPFWVDPGDPDDPDPNAGGAVGLWDSGDLDGRLAILDAWGTPIRVVHPGRLHNPSPPFEDPVDVRDPDGTVRVDNRFSNAENIYGVARNQRICFVSAGPDKRFGTLGTGFVAEGGDESVRDNIYSYPLEAP